MQDLAYTLITSQSDLDECVDYLQHQEAVYLDLEFDKNHFTFGFTLCLMQIASEDKCFLIDPIAGLDLSTIFPILENPKIRIFTYAFSEDIRLLHHIGCMAKNIVDLAIARTILNKPHISLNNLIEEKTGQTLSKSQQKSNWCNRPLTEDQLKYAAADVVYLPQISRDVFNELEEANRMSWLKDEIAYLDAVDYSEEYHFITVKENEKKNYTKREWMRYLALLELREELAKEINRPGYRALDKRLIELLAKSPKKIAQWPDYKMNIHPRLKHRAIKHKIQQLFKELESEFESQNISEDAPAREFLNQTERAKRNAERNEFERKKSEYYLPLKEKIKEKYGENIANYLLSNRLIMKYFYNGLEPMPYQKRIFEELG